MNLMLASFLPVIWLLYLLIRVDRGRPIYQLQVNGCALQEKTAIIFRSWLNQRVGLLNHARVDGDTAYVFPRCYAVTTAGMLDAIDIVFLNRYGQVLAVEVNVPPGIRRVKGPAGSYAVIETAACKARPSFGLRLGCQVTLL